MKLQSVLTVIVVAVVLTTVGCQQPTSSDSGRTDGFSAWDSAIADRAGLIDKLPDNTIAYLRLPGVWGLATAPKSSALGRGLDTPANREAIAALQARLPELLAAELGQLAPVLTLLLETLRSPLEVALVGDGPQPLEADLVIEGRFDFETVAELDAAMTELTDQAGLLQMLEPAEGEGPGQILATMFPIFYDFDPDTRRARFLTGMSASAEALADSYEWQPAAESPMRDFEQQIDASGHGLFLWADMAQLGPMMRQGLDDEELAQFEALGVFATRQLALGYGSSGGKARLAVLAEGREGQAWELTLPASDPIGFRSSGQPDAVLGLVVPGNDWLRRAFESMGEHSDTELAEANAWLEKEIDIDLHTAIDTFAGQLIFVDDDNGSYLVLEGSGVENWTHFWDALARRFDIRQSTSPVSNTEIHHLVIPGIDLDEEMADLRDDNPALAFFISRSMQVGTHLFWLPEGDRILIATVPQVLLARLDHPGDVVIGEWLANAGVGTERAGLFGALRIDDAPRRNYYAYISSLLGLADMLETEIDVSAFPTARELDLPGTGTIGFAVDYADGRLGATLAFENHPGDLLYAGGGSLGGVAALGILAAVAVPAYQDYTVRAKLAAAYASTADFRNLLARHVAEQGELPDDTLARDWAAAIPLGPHVAEAIWQTEPAALRLTLIGDSGLDDGAELLVVPQIEDDRLSGWSCTSETIEDKQLPSSCR